LILLAGTASLCYRFEDIVSVSFWDKSGQNQCFIFQQEVIACLLKAVHLLYMCYSSALKAFVLHFLGLHFYFVVFFFCCWFVFVCFARSQWWFCLCYKFSGISFLYLHTWVNFEIWASIIWVLGTICLHCVCFVWLLSGRLIDMGCQKWVVNIDIILCSYMV